MKTRKTARSYQKTFWKNTGCKPSISWPIISKAQPYHSRTRSCNLCTEEKFAILMANPKTALNKRSEVLGKCRHKNKFNLKNLSFKI